MPTPDEYTANGRRAAGASLPILPSVPPAPQDLLDPSIAQGVEGFAVPEMTLEVVEMIQSMGSSIFAATELSDAVERTDHLVPGDPDVALRVHRRTGAEGLRPGLYSMHGGGYMIGSYDMDDAMFDDRCADARHRRCVGRVPARSGDAVSRSARRLLPRFEVDLRPRRRTRHRSRSNRRDRCQCRRWPRRPRWHCSRVIVVKSRSPSSFSTAP